MIESDEMGTDVEKMIERCLIKDAGAWDEFVRAYRGVVIRSVRYKLKRLNIRLISDEFKDIVQEVFMDIWEKDKLTKIRDYSSIEAWLAILSINKVSNYCRKCMFKKPECISLNTPGTSGSGRDLCSFLSDDASCLSKNLHYSEMKAFIIKELKILGGKKKAAMMLYLFNSMKQKDISGIMRVPENTVATLIRRARKQIREKLDMFLEERQLSRHGNM